MADDTAALVVALSAQFTRFEKDLQKAVGIADQKTKQIENSFSRVNKSINSQLGALASSFSGRIGGVGTVLSSFGKAGVVAAVGIGAAVAAITAAVNVAGRFVEQADQLEQSAQNIGVTITQLKALGLAGLAANQSFERTEQSFIRFIGSVEQLRDASGPLYEALRKTDKELLLQLTNAQNSAEAIDLLVKAFARLEDQSKRVALARAAGFRGAAVGTLDELAQRGALTGATGLIGNVDEQIKKLADMNKELEILKQKTFDITGAFGAEASLRFWIESHKQIQAVVDVLEKVRSFDFSSLFRPPPGTQTRGGIDESGFISAFGGLGVPLPTAKPQQPTPTLKPTIEQEVAALKRTAAVLGEAITLTEQYTLKKKELQLAVASGEVTREQEKRVLAEVNRAQQVAISTALERFGIAERQAIVDGKLAEIEQAKAKGLITSAQAMQATTLAMKEANEEADKLAVRRSLLPGLKQLELDAKNVNKAMDDLAVGSLNKLTDALADVVTGTKTVKEAFADLVKFIASELAKLAIRQGLIAPLAGLIGLTVPGNNQHGTSNWRGGWTWVGEKGPELVNLPKGSQVVPNEVARGGVGGVSVGVTSTIVVQGDASERTLMLIEGALARQKRELPNDIIKTVQQMHSRRVA